MRKFDASFNTPYPIGEKGKQKIDKFLIFISLCCQWFVFFTIAFVAIFSFYKLFPADKMVDPLDNMLLLAGIIGIMATIIKNMNKI